jgi:hypothetical protein
VSGTGKANVHRCSCGLSFRTAQKLATHIEKGNVGYGRGASVKHRKVEVTSMQLAFAAAGLKF